MPFVTATSTAAATSNGATNSSNAAPHTPGYVASRLKLTELSVPVIKAFANDEIGVGHALLLAKLQHEQQEEALAACYQESYGNGSNPGPERRD